MSPKLQDCARVGLAVKDADGAVVKFVSYEVTVTASNGPASGVRSSVNGKSETRTTTVGYSLQLSGSGAKASDFTWQTPRSNSFGACNAGQALEIGRAHV